MSQFWYSTPFANHLAASLKAICEPTTRVAFLSSPTGYVAFQSQPSPLKRTLLFEYDDRFQILPVVGRTKGERRAGKEREEIGVEEGGFVHYDLYEPEKWSAGLRGTVNLAVIDPPYLNEVSSTCLFPIFATLAESSIDYRKQTNSSLKLYEPSWRPTQNCSSSPQLPFRSRFSKNATIFLSWVS